MRGGYVVVPLNWRRSDEALGATAAKFRPEALLYSEDFAAQAERIESAAEVEVALRIEDVAGPDAEPAPPVPDGTWREPQRDDLYALIGTGGTTGTPKGVPVTNAMVEACTIGQLCTRRWHAGDVLLFLPQLFHNPHFYIVPPLLMGGTIVVPEMTSFDAPLLLRTIERERVTMFGAVSTMLTYMRDAQADVGADLSSLETLGYGGSPFAPVTLKSTMEVFDCDMLQFYGQTETSILITCLGPEEHREAIADPALAHRLRSAGQVVPMIELRVVDEDGRDCPRDRATVGEIAARGPSVMGGYFEDPERTAETLRDGWCLTGDMGTWDEDGYLYIVDRRKDMIISGGENIYPQAVEDVIVELPGVAGVAVVGVPDPVWGEVVKAVIVAREGASVTADDVQSLCAERLARYMRPRLVEFVDDLPKSPTGRILRREVRDQHAGAAGDGTRKLGEV
jgi:long-chain acyl-CoA synthetase